MFGIPFSWKIGAGIALAMVVGGFVLWAQHEHARANKEAGIVALWARCDQEASSAALSGAVPSDLQTNCSKTIAMAVAKAAMARAYDDALSARPENSYGAGASCSTAVKTVQAARDGALGERDKLAAELQRTRDQRDADIGRAEARASLQAERKANAEAAVARAPRDSDGSVVCGADCLRDRWGQAGSQPH
jgi:hypothetical protein